MIKILSAEDARDIAFSVPYNEKILDHVMMLISGEINKKAKRGFLETKIYLSEIPELLQYSETVVILHYIPEILTLLKKNKYKVSIEENNKLIVSWKNDEQM